MKIFNNNRLNERIEDLEGDLDDLKDSIKEINQNAFGKEDLKTDLFSVYTIPNMWMPRTSLKEKVNRLQDQLDALCKHFNVAFEYKQATDAEFVVKPVKKKK